MWPSHGPALCQTSHGEGEDKFQPLVVFGVALGKRVIKRECGLYVSCPSCDGLPGNELSHREGEDKFQPLDVCGVALGKGVIKRECGLHVSRPSCDGPHVEKMRISFNL
jgi:hypothetical protein